MTATLPRESRTGPAAHVLGLLGFPGEDLAAAWPLGGWETASWRGRGTNETLELHTGAGRFFLRRSFRGRTLAALQFQAELLAALAAAGFPVPLPVPATDGALVLSRPEADGTPRHYMLGPAMPGRQLNPTGGAIGLRLMGRTLARYHAVAAAFAARHPEPNQGTLPMLLDATLRVVDPALDPDLHQHGQAVHARLRQLWPSLPSTLQHGGYRPSSVLVENGKLTGFLDVDSARPGPRCVDISTALRDVATVRTESDRPDDKIALDPARVRAFLDGYRATAPVDSVEAEAIVVVMAAKRIRRGLARYARLEPGETPTPHSLDKIEAERARVAWLDANHDRLVALCTG